MGNKIRNSIIVGTVLSMMFAQASFAATIDNVKENMSAQTISVSGSGLVKNDNVLIEIYDYEQDSIDYVEDLEGVLVVSADENGKYSAEFKLPTGVLTGSKLVRVKPVLGNYSERELDFFSTSSITEFITDWNTAINDQDEALMKDILDNTDYLKIILNTSLAPTLQKELLGKNKTSLTGQLLEMEPIESVVSEIEDEFINYYLKYAINNLTDKTLAKLTLEFYNKIDTVKGDVYTNIISKLSDEEKLNLFEKVAKVRKGNMSIASYAELIYPQAVYEAFTNISYYKDVKGFIELYNEDYFKVDFSDYNALKNTYNVDSKVLSLKNEYSDFDSFRKKYAEWIKVQKKSEQSSGGGGGGGQNYGNAAPLPVASEDFVEDVVFDDLTDFEWAEEHIMALYNKGAVDGVGSKKFEPTGITTREQFVKMISALLTVEDNPESAGFADVSENEWYTKYVNNAKAIGLISGKEDNTFGIGENITREDAAVICFNALKLQEPAMVEDVEIEKLNFKDADKISTYAIYAVSVLNKLDIIKGDTDGCINPTATTTRAEAATMINRVLSLIQ